MPTRAELLVQQPQQKLVPKNLQRQQNLVRKRKHLLARRSQEPHRADKPNQDSRNPAHRSLGKNVLPSLAITKQLQLSVGSLRNLAAVQLVPEQKRAGESAQAQARRNRQQQSQARQNLDSQNQGNRSRDKQNLGKQNLVLRNLVHRRQATQCHAQCRNPADAQRWPTTRFPLVQETTVRSQRHVPAVPRDQNQGSQSKAKASRLAMAARNHAITVRVLQTNAPEVAVVQPQR